VVARPPSAKKGSGRAGLGWPTEEKDQDAPRKKLVSGKRTPSSQEMKKSRDLGVRRRRRGPGGGGGEVGGGGKEEEFGDRSREDLFPGKGKSSLGGSETPRIVKAVNQPT